MAALVVIGVGVGLNSKGVFVAPTPTPVPVADQERSLLKSYYEKISGRNLQGAYKLLSPSEQKTLKYDDLVHSFDTTVAATLSNVSVANDTVSFRVNQQDKTDAGLLNTISDGTWHVVSGAGGAGSGLLLDDRHMSLLYSTYFTPGHLQSAAVPDTYNKVKQSLAFVVARTADEIGTGTAICIGSDESDSYFLTNSHVALDGQIVVVPMNTWPTPYDATVLFRGTDVDAAILQIHTPAIPVAILAGGLPPEGQPIAIAGFPYTQIELAEAVDQGLKGLSPSLHQGTVNSVAASGRLIEYDATTDHGNSGGPLFDPSTGVVYGMVTWIAQGDSLAVQNNFALSMPTLWPFINQSKVRVLSTRGF